MKYTIRKHIEGVWRVVHDDVAFEDLPEPVQRSVVLLDARDISSETVSYVSRSLEDVGARIDWETVTEYYLIGGT